MNQVIISEVKEILNNSLPNDIISYVIADYIIDNPDQVVRYFITNIISDVNLCERMIGDFLNICEEIKNWGDTGWGNEKKDTEVLYDMYKSMWYGIREKRFSLAMCTYVRMG